MLIFHNPGEIDIRGACIAGLSAKESKSPIGFFGTGLKYSIACILRWGGSITIYSGERQYDFVSDSLTFRGSEFMQVVMRTHGEGHYVETALGFTTEYGKNWQPWQVFRELYANARDEGGVVELNTHHSQIGAGWTHIFVNCPKLEEQYYKRDTIILPKNQIWEQESAAVQFNAVRSPALYYRGVRVEERACLFTWNFLEEIILTEDRTPKEGYAFSIRVEDFISQHLHDIDAIMILLEGKITGFADISYMTEKNGTPLEVKSKPAEYTFMNWFTLPTEVHSTHSAEFKQACIRLYQRDPTTFSKLRPYVKSIDSALVEERAHNMTAREQLMFDKAKELCALFGFADEIARLPIHVQDLGGQTLGLHERGTIYLSPKLFDQGTKQLVATLYEELYHYRTQEKDCTYNMQSDLFNIIISLNEELHKVIC